MSEEAYLLLEFVRLHKQAWTDARAWRTMFVLLQDNPGRNTDFHSVQRALWAEAEKIFLPLETALLDEQPLQVALQEFLQSSRSDRV